MQYMSISMDKFGKMYIYTEVKNDWLFYEIYIDNIFIIL